MPKKKDKEVSLKKAPLPSWAQDLPWSNIEEYATEFKLDPMLVAAIIMVESSNNPFAMRFEPDYRWTLPQATIKALSEHVGCTVETMMIAQKHSCGPMQIMSAIAYDQYGFRGWISELCSNDQGIYYGCSHLANFVRKYHLEEEAVSAYNRGHPARTPGGLFINQKYVDKVYGYLRELRKID